MAHVAAGGIRCARRFGIGGQKKWALGTPVTTGFNDPIVSANGGADTFPWANNLGWNVDKFGNDFMVVDHQVQAANRGQFIWRNRGTGSTQWTDSPTLSLNDGQPGELACDQGMIAYDAVNDVIHMHWVGDDNTTGFLYRRYIPVRDGSNNFTGITWDGTLATRTNLQFDFNGPLGATLQLHWLNDPAYGQYGALIATWGMFGGGHQELRASMCVFGATANQGKTAANWTDIGVTTSNVSVGSTVNVAYTALMQTTGAQDPGGVIYRIKNGPHAGDLAIGYYDGVTGNWTFRRAVWNATSHNWTSLTTPVPICALIQAGTDSGYTLKQQLMSQISEDASGNCYVGVSTWQNNTAGDTWNVAKIDTSDTVTVVPAYAWNGPTTATPFLAPAGSVQVDAQTNLVLVSHVTATGAALQAYTTDLVKSGAELSIYPANTPADVPTIADKLIGGNVMVYGRDAINSPTPPYHGWYVSVPWV